MGVHEIFKMKFLDTWKTPLKMSLLRKTRRTLFVPVQMGHGYNEIGELCDVFLCILKRSFSLRLLRFLRNMAFLSHESDKNNVLKTSKLQKTKNPGLLFKRKIV